MGARWPLSFNVGGMGIVYPGSVRLSQAGRVIGPRLIPIIFRLSSFSRRRGLFCKRSVFIEAESAAIAADGDANGKRDGVFICREYCYWCTRCRKK